MKDFYIVYTMRKNGELLQGSYTIQVKECIGPKEIIRIKDMIGQENDIGKEQIVITNIIPLPIK